MNIKGKICLGYTLLIALIGMILAIYRPTFIDPFHSNLEIIFYFVLVQALPILFFKGYLWLLNKFQGDYFYSKKYERIESSFVQFKEIFVFISVRTIIFSVVCLSGLVSIGTYSGNLQSTFYLIIYALFLLLVIYETAFYFVHYLSHKYKFLYKLCHYKHHQNIKNVWSTLYSAHYLDNLLISLGYAFGVMLCSKIIPVSYEAIYISLSWVCYIEIAGHSDIEGTKLLGFNKAHKIFSTISAHALHHLRYKENMGLMTRFWDRVMKTESPDYEEITERMFKGEVLEEIFKEKSKRSKSKDLD